MLLCASAKDNGAVEPLQPPAGAAVGERVWFGEGGREQVRARLTNHITLHGYYRYYLESCGAASAQEACKLLLRFAAVV